MSSCAVVDRDAVTAAFDALDAAVEGVLGLDFEALTTRERLALLERCERVRRRLPAVEHPLIDQLAHQATPEELGGKLSHAVAEWALISRGEAARRIREAVDLGPRRTITGEPLAPVLAATAAGQREGKLGTGHVAVIRRFYHQLPGWVDHFTREQTEARLAKEGSQLRPEQLTGLADTLADYLNPDGTFTDGDRARRRGLTLGNQQADGTSQLRGWLTPEARATLEAVWAKLAAPGMCNPTDDTPCVDGTPSQEAIDGDARSAPQRNHDALLAALRSLLASGKLGQHNGLPASIIVTTTLGELEAAAGKGLTGGGTTLPISDVIRLARHAHHYLAIFRQRQCPGAVSHQTTRLTRPANHALRQRPWLFCTRMHGARVLLRSPPHHRLRQMRHHGRQQPHLRLRPPPSATATKRMDHPTTRQRRHPMDPTPTPRPRPTPKQHLPSPRETPARRGRRRRVVSATRQASRGCTR